MSHHIAATSPNGSPGDGTRGVADRTRRHRAFRRASIAAIATLACAWPASAIAATPGTRADEQCAPLGQASGYDVFSDGVYEADNTTVHGRVAARGNVKVSAIGMGTDTTGGYDVVTGGDITGTGGQVQGDVRYGGALHFDPTFSVVGTSSKGDPPFDFGAEFTRLRELSASLAELPDTPGNTIELQYGELLLSTGDRSHDRYVFHVSAARLASGQTIKLDLPAGATAIIDVEGPQASFTQTNNMTLVGIDAAHVLWNFAGVDDLTLSGSVPWKGTLLAPDTEIRVGNSHDLRGQVIAKDARLGALAIASDPFAGCLPAPPEPAPIELDALCADASGNLALRLRNRGTRDLTDVTWRDLDSPQSGSFTAFARRDRFFHVDVSDGRSHRIQVSSGSTTVEATGKPRPCRGRLTVHEQVVGQSPGGTWNVVLSGAGGPVGSVALADGETFTSDKVPGGYVEGSVPIGQTPGGTPYTVSEPDPRGGVAVVSQYLVEITDGDAADVLVTTFYRGTPIIPIQPPTVPIHPTDPIRPVLPTDPIRPVVPTDPITPVVPVDPIRPVVPTDPITPVVPTDPTRPVKPTDPIRPVLPTDPIRPIVPTDPTIPVVPTDPVRPPGEPDPPTGPGLIPAPPTVDAADLQVTYSISPRRFRVGAIVSSVVRVRNRGKVTAVGAVLRELPQFAGPRAGGKTRILSLTAGSRNCPRSRPARCTLGAIAPGRQVTVRARTRVDASGRLYSAVLASSRTAETNLTNNVALGDLTGREPTPRVRVRVDAPPTGRVGTRLTYRVTVTGAGVAGARAARLCTRIPESLVDRRAPGTFAYRGMRCRDVGPLPVGRSRSFLVHGVPSRGRRLPARAAAAAVGTTRVARDVAYIRIPATACAASVPIAHAAC